MSYKKDGIDASELKFPDVPPIEKQLDGQCLCGAVTYSVKAGAKPVYSVACHCINCKRATGTSFVTNTIFKKAVRSLRSTL